MSKMVHNIAQIIKLFFKKNFVYIDVFPACMYVCARVSGESIGYPTLSVVNGCAPPHGFWRPTQPQSSVGATSVLSAELQTPRSFFLNSSSDC